MSTARDFRRINLLALLGKEKGAQAALARDLEVEPAYVSQLVTSGPGARNMGHKTARRIEKLRGLREGWMDEPHDEAAEGASMVPLESQLVAMFKDLSPESKLLALETVQALYLGERKQPYGPTVFEADVHERREAPLVKKRPRASAK